jgi:hypothetical protein
MHCLSSNAVSVSIRMKLVPCSFHCLLCRLLEFLLFLVKVLKDLEPLLTRRVEGPFSLRLLEISTKTKTHNQPKAANKSVRLQCLHKMYFVLVNYRLNNTVSYQTSVHTS